MNNLKKIIIIRKNALTKRYKLRKTGRQWLSWETTIPREVIEREACRTGVPISEFQKQFEAEWLFDNFDGLHLIFVPKNVAEDASRQKKCSRENKMEANSHAN